MYTTFAFLDLGTPDLLIILAIVLLICGGRKLPELSKALGESITELRSGMADSTAESKRPAKSNQVKKGD